MYVCDPGDILCISDIFQAAISPGICLTDNSKLNFQGCVLVCRYTFYREDWQAAALPPCENIPAHSAVRPILLEVTLNQVSK